MLRLYCYRNTQLRPTRRCAPQSFVRFPILQPPDSPNLNLLCRCAIGGMSISADRMRDTDGFINPSTENCSGGLMHSTSSSHTTDTPMLSNTSISRFTSSIRAMPFSRVCPRLSNAAHNSATDPFFDEFVTASPDNLPPPRTKKSTVFLYILAVYRTKSCKKCSVVL